MFVLVNGIYWVFNVLRFFIYDDVRNFFKIMNRFSVYGGCLSLFYRLLVICDILVDIEVII